MSKLPRLSKLSDLPAVVVLAWAGWLAVPWSFSGLAQAQAAAAEAAAQTVPHDPARVAAEVREAPAPAEIRAPTVDARPPAVETRGVEARGAGVDVRGGVPADDPVRQAETVRQAGPYKTWGMAARRDAVAMERARIAGEVHDAAGHGLAAIAMQAGLALVTLDENPEQARASLLAIKETSTQALAHLRAALDGIEAEGDLPGLIDGVRAAGLPVDVEPAEPKVPADLSGAVYKVVRESLTNVLRHAGPTRALVRLSADPGVYVVEVADRGAGWSGAAEGRGLTGMRARVQSAGGQFAAGPREGGGFRVIARFPRTGDTA
ncbi:sensor histidine kinase [Nonomuraea endophytica]|uniref:histidine kinase n=1 Tax=Nonomuraea endophytica TaxID=714136 RepID=A0A7W8A9Y1_9ACTN|nr:sensor histidine kinase [Nonomuraea endophytica]MBB5082366.1 signal transduction histidine kinase [Nonomuraea endophytica]